MAQVAVGAAHVIRGIVVIPVADNTRGKSQERDKRQTNTENSNHIPHRRFSKPRMGHHNLC